MILESLLLCRRPLRGPRRDQAVRALRHPAGDARWDEEVYRRHGLQRPEAEPGMPLLLAATVEEGSLWTLAPEHWSQCDDKLTGSADEAWWLAERVARRTIPVVGDPAQLYRQAPPGLWLLSHRQTRHLSGVVGRSFGLAFCLGAISRIAGVPVAPDLAASAELDEEGSLSGVRHLRQKLEALRAWAPGVRRLIVALDQAAEAEKIVQRLQGDGGVADPWLVVIGARTVQESLEHAFPAALGRHTVSPSGDHQADLALAEVFLELLLDEPASPPRWDAVARGTAGLRAHPHPHVRWMACTVHAVASRHVGQPMAIPSRPEDLRISRRDLVVIEAQVVQTANDCCAPDWDAVLASAEPLVPLEGEEWPGHLNLLGALGRLNAAQGHYRLAVALLERAVDGWFLHRNPGPASRPICELLRLSGVLADPALRERVDNHARRCLAVLGRDEHGRGFLQLARGRASVVLGEGARALVELTDAGTAWPLMPTHLQASRLRWLARVQPDPSGWLRELIALAEREPDEAKIFHLLALADAGDARAMERAQGSWAAQWARTGAVEPTADLARRLVIYPY